MKRFLAILLALCVFTAIVARRQCSVAGGDGAIVDLTILSTTDIHNNYMDYDYFTDLPTERFGLLRLATAIREQRAQNTNVLLFDNGDNLQGNPLGEFLARNPPRNGEVSPIMALMNAMSYDAMNLGNHDFDFGLDYLNAVISGAGFPVISANMIDANTRRPYFRPYAILQRDFRDRNGRLQNIRIGVLGLLPSADQLLE